MMSGHTFFFNKKMACSSSISAFIANASNSIMKSAIFFFSCLKDSIFHLASAAFVLSLNVVLIYLTKSSKFWVLSSLSSSLSFLCAYMSGMVYTGMEVHRIDSEMSRLVEQPWLQLMCCAVCLLHGCNFRY